jgi:hypothetical protein
MARKTLAAVVATATAGTIALTAPWSANAHTAAGSAYEPVLDPANFVSVIDNPYYPLPVGRKLVYKGTKDGQTQRDVVTVTHRTKVVAEGITATVVTDVAKHGRRLLEKTEDWFAQDKQGNVWYLGEDTSAYAKNGKVDKTGSWEAGVYDAEPGIIMEAHPRIPDAYRQELRRGTAEDTAWVVRTNGSVTVPYRTVHHVLVTLEATRVEPGAYDKKVYAKGIGIVLERALTGDPEVAKLVSVTG